MRQLACEARFLFRSQVPLLDKIDLRVFLYLAALWEDLLDVAVDKVD